MTTPQVTAYTQVPPFAAGLVRDLRVRWAGRPYDAVLLDHATKDASDYRDWQPFGQVPAYRDGDVEMFESGAIVLQIAETSEALMPRDPAGRARTMSWVIAALNSVEPFVGGLVETDIFHAGEAWTRERRPQVEALAERRLAAVAHWLGDKPYLEGERFTAGDLIMTTVLRELRHCDLLDRFPTLKAYQQRCEARPAFQRALAAQLEPFQRSEAA